MIEVYIGGNMYYECYMNINSLFNIMSDDFIGPDTFVEFKLSDGNMAYVRKSSIISFNSVVIEESR